MTTLDPTQNRTTGIASCLHNSQVNMIKLSINGQDHEVDVAPDTPLLWVIRDTLGMTGTRFGCGMGLCGACTMHMGGNAVRTCILPVSAAAGMPLTTIEGLDNHVVQDAWLKEQVPQCGYCQSGQLMAAAPFVEAHAGQEPTDAQIGAAITNICRCGTYDRIRKAVRRACKALPAPPPPPPPSVEPVPVDAEQPSGTDGGQP